MTTREGTASEEIVIVGSRYGELADEMSLLYKMKDPIEMKDIRNALGDVIVYLSPAKGLVDKQAVSVYTESSRRLGYVWMCQSHNIHAWMVENHQEYLGVRIKEVNTVANVLIAETLSPINLPKRKRCSTDIDYSWASNLPMLVPSIKIESLHMSIFLLNQALEEEQEWSDLLKLRIDNLLISLPLELSAYSNEACMELYLKMRASKIDEVRRQADYVLYSLVHRGSKEHINGWLENWLPDVFNNAAESDLLGMFEAANYTLERVEDLLHQAPEHLFHLFKVNRTKFAFTLYYASLPEELYNRLMTLLAVHELMLQKSGKGTDAPKAAKAADPSVSKIVRFPNDFTKQCFMKVVHDFYLGDAVNLALIEVVLFDHSQLMKRSKHTAFLNLLITWGILPKTLDVKKTANGMSQKLNSLPKEAYLDWGNNYASEREYCKKIGADLPESMRYGRIKT